MGRAVIRQSALCHPALSKSLGAPSGAARRECDFRASDPARGRGALSGVPDRGNARRFAASLLRAGEGIQSRFHRAVYADRLRPRHAFIAIEAATGQMLGVVRVHADSEYRTAEYAILVRSDLKGHGLGWLLMELMIEYARAEGLQSIRGQVLQENRTMLQMCRQLGFHIA